MNRAEKIICTGCLFLILIHLVASYFPEERLWGVNLLYFLPPVWRWALVICAISVLVPRLNRVVGVLVTRVYARMPAWFRRINKYYRYTLISLLGAFLFWLLRVNTFLLGDSFLRAREINQGAKFSFTAPLDFLLHVKAASALGWDAFRTYAALSVVGGGVFLFLILSMAGRFGKTHGERALSVIVLVTMGSTLLFFGYVESYTLPYLATVAYLLACLGYCKRTNGMFLPILLFLAAFGLHVSALVLLPSLLYLILFDPSTEARSERARSWSLKLALSAGIITVVAAGLLLLQSYNPEDKGLRSFLIFPLGSGESSYSLFSFAQVADFVNHQLLISPVGVLLCLVSILGFPGKVNLKDKVVPFLLVVTACSLGYALLVDPKLGYPRDWDLFAFTGLGYTFLGLYLLQDRWRQAKMGELRYLILSLFLTSVIVTAPWVYVNAAEQKAVARFEQLLDLDRERSAYGRENLAMYYGERGDFDAQIRQWKKAIAVSGNARYITNLGVTYYNLGMLDLALKELESSLEVDSTFDFTHFCMGEIFSRQGRHEEAIDAYRKAVRYRPSLTQYYDNLGTLLSNLGRYQEALEVFEQGLNATPGYPSIYRNLGYTYFNLGDALQAEKYLKLYLEQSPQADDRGEVMQVLRNVQQMKFEKAKP
jgi:tetratricopeptide (TPR) repeat protein